MRSPGEVRLISIKLTGGSAVPRITLPLDNCRLDDYRWRRIIARVLARELKQKRDFTSRQQEVMLSGEIANRMITRDPDITRLVDRLERRGLVARIRGRQDRRVVEVGITEKGQELVRSLDEPVDRFPRHMLGHLGPKKLEQLGVLLEQALTELGTFP